MSDRDTLAKPCYDLQGLLDNYTWVTEIVEAMNGLGWDVYSFDHEDVMVSLKPILPTAMH